MDESGPSSGEAFSATEWELVKELVFECQLQGPSDLKSWLDTHCSSEKVRREVERLVRSATTCGDFLQQPVPDKYFGVSRKVPARIGRYRVIEEIGAGGMGVVYAAYDEELNRRVAIKVLLAQTAEDPELRKRLRWDAQTASALQHPNIVTVHEVGFDGGLEYVAMECISGKTLGRLIPVGGMESLEALRYAVQIASGLEAAHLAGVVHRDLKPSNIMVNDSGVVKLLDFGLAKGLGAGFQTGDAPLTIEGKFAGTVAYVSPEQAEGKAVDVRSDIFSFGSVLYEMLTDRRAFPGDSAISVLADILHTNPPGAMELHAQVDPRLDEIVQRCLRKDRARRFQSIGEVKIRLQEIAEEIQYAKQDRSAAQAAAPTQAALPPSGGMLRGAIIGAVATATLAVAGFLIARDSETVIDRQIVLTRATSDSGLTEFPAISPDHQFLAYASDRSGDGNLNIWMQQVKGSEPQARTSNPADDYEPQFSPDGTKLLFRSEREGGGLYIMPAHGGSERLLAARGHGGQFSPDGKSVAFWIGETGAIFRPGCASIYIIPTAGGTARPFRPDFLAAAYPVWAHRGDRLLFLAREKGAGSPESKVDWWVASIDGTYTRATHLLSAFSEAGLRELPGSDWLAPAAWLPGDNRVLFSATHGDASNIWAVGLNEDGVSFEAPRRYTAGTTLELHPSATEAGGIVNLAFATVAASTGVWRIPLDAQGKPSGSMESLITGYDNIASPSISWDGSRIVFATHMPEGQAIRVKELNTVPRVITETRTRKLARPVLSGDGGTLAYSNGRNGYILHLSTGESQKICESCGPPTHLSFDGREVLFESADASDQILKCTTRKGPVPLIRWEGTPSMRQAGARFSPDSRWVVFSGSPMDSSQTKIWIAPVREQGRVRKDELTQITDGESIELEPYWAPDGQTIYFLSDTDGFHCIWARHVDPVTSRPRGAPFPVAHFHNARMTLQSSSHYSGDIGLSVSRNSLVFMMSERTSNIWLQSETSRSR